MTLLTTLYLFLVMYAGCSPACLLFHAVLLLLPACPPAFIPTFLPPAVAANGAAHCYLALLPPFSPPPPLPSHSARHSPCPVAMPAAMQTTISFIAYTCTMPTVLSSRHFTNTMVWDMGMAECSHAIHEWQ